MPTKYRRGTGRHVARVNGRGDHDLVFPNLHRERERARELFDIDIDASLRGWMEQLGWSGRSSSSEFTTPAVLLLDLSAREREVLSYAACGYTKEQIGRRLHLSMETIKSHQKHIRAKFRTQSIVHAITLALILGELDAEILRKELLRRWEEVGVVR